MNPLLKMAVQAGAEKAVSLHLNKVTYIDETDDKGMTLLMLAALRGHSETCRILLEAGATPFLHNLDGLSAQCLAQANGHTETVSVICRFSANVAETPEVFSSSVSGCLTPDFLIETNNPDSDIFDDWDEEPESITPENDPSHFFRAGDIQCLISEHLPENLDEDWMDIHIELPEFTWAHAKGYLLHDFLQTEKNLFLHGIYSGRLVSCQIDAMAELVEDQPDNYAENLQEVMNDLGVRIDNLSCDYAHPCCLEELDLESDEPEVQLVEDAIRFLWEKNNPAHDPYWLYMRDVRSFSLLAASEEIDLGRMADEGSSEIFKAAMVFAPAITELIAIVKAGGWNIIAELSDESHGENLLPEEGETVDEVADYRDNCISEELEMPDYHGEEQRGDLLNRIESVSNSLAEVIRMNTVGKRDSEECVRQMQLIYDELVGVRFTSVVLYRLGSVIHRYNKILQQSLDRIRMVCISIVGMSKETFQELFTGNETNLDWCKNVMSSQTEPLASGIAIHSNEILDEQIRLLELEKALFMPLSEFIKLCDRLQAGEGKLRHAHYRMTVSNLRLAHHIATKYRSSGLPLSDLVQEANIGLLKAVERFDYRRGFRFSTFATWWIRQSVTRAIADKSRSIRIPVHVVESLNKIKRAINELEAVGSGAVIPEDIAELAELPIERVLKILKLPEDPLSIDALEEETPGFVESLPECEDSDPEIEALEADRSEIVAIVLATLKPNEEKVIKMRFGFGEEKACTLEEIGQCFNVTRERIRQIEAKALINLRHPSRSKRLEVFVS